MSLCLTTELPLWDYYDIETVNTCKTLREVPSAEEILAKH